MATSDGMEIRFTSSSGTYHTFWILTSHVTSYSSSCWNMTVPYTLVVVTRPSGRQIDCSSALTSRLVRYLMSDATCALAPESRIQQSSSEFLVIPLTIDNVKSFLGCLSTLAGPLCRGWTGVLFLGSAPADLPRFLNQHFHSGWLVRPQCLHFFFGLVAVTWCACRVVLDFPLGVELGWEWFTFLA